MADEYIMTDEEKEILNACLNQSETVRSPKTENVFERARTDDADAFAKYFEARVNSRSAFITVLNAQLDD